jgi:hypothetical protein
MSLGVSYRRLRRFVMPNGGIVVPTEAAVEVVGRDYRPLLNFVFLPVTASTRTYPGTAK